MVRSFNNWRSGTANYIREDFCAYPLRFCLKLLGWEITHIYITQASLTLTGMNHGLPAINGDT
jgi:hypothetical protein